MKLDNVVPNVMRDAHDLDSDSAIESNLAAPIRVLVPDLPTAEDLLPSLRRIDERRWYTNAGPLVGEFEAGLASLIGSAGSRRTA